MAKQKEIKYALPIGTVLKNGRYPYQIREVLGQGSYGIVYRVATKINIDGTRIEVSFAIKENFTKDFCSREVDGVTMKYPSEFEERAKDDLNDFLAEGKWLANICKGNENIVSVNETFKENGTYYYVMEYIDGISLHDIVVKNGRLTEQESIKIMAPIIEAVNVVHSNELLHLDIKPENIMLKKTGEPILIDFGITLHFSANGERTITSKDRPVGCSDGFAPMEQYLGVEEFSPEVDVYALGATLYYLLVGNEPKKASEIKSDWIKTTLPTNVSNEVRNAIVNAMQPSRFDRTRTAKEFARQLGIETSKKESTKSTSKKTRSQTRKVKEEPTVPKKKKPQNPINHEPAKRAAKLKKELEPIILTSESTSTSNHGLVIGVCVLVAFVVFLFLYPRILSPSESNSSDVAEVTESIYVKDFPIYDSAGNVEYIYDGYLINGIPDHYSGFAKYTDNDPYGRLEYQGPFVNGKRQGDNGAQLTYKNGDSYKGSFSDDHFDEGTYTIKKDGSYFKGTFNNNEPYNGTWYYKSGKKMSDVINGIEK